MEAENQKTTATKIWWRQWSVVFILAVLAAFVIWALLQAGPWLRGWQERSAANALRKQAEEQLRNDKYGGKTPEETFDMFIAALEKGDVELASKYFILNKQEQWRKTLEEYKTSNLLSDFVSELESQRSRWVVNSKSETGTAVFDYQVVVKKDSFAKLGNQNIKIEAGEYWNTTMFERYSSGIWKISVL